MRRKTYILDIDGTIVKHNPSFWVEDTPAEPLPGVIEKLHEWRRDGHMVILLTARSEQFRDLTINQLNRAGIMWDQLIMGATSGQRILVNDQKPNAKDPSNPTAVAINLKRNEGFLNVDIW